MQNLFTCGHCQWCKWGMRSDIHFNSILFQLKARLETYLMQHVCRVFHTLSSSNQVSKLHELPPLNVEKQPLQSELPVDCSDPHSVTQQNPVPQACWDFMHHWPWTQCFLQTCAPGIQFKAKLFPRDTKYQEDNNFFTMIWQQQSRPQRWALEVYLLMYNKQDVDTYFKIVLCTLTLNQWTSCGTSSSTN